MGWCWREQPKDLNLGALVNGNFGYTDVTRSQFSKESSLNWSSSFSPRLIEKTSSRESICYALPLASPPPAWQRQSWDWDYRSLRSTTCDFCANFTRKCDIRIRPPKIVYAALWLKILLIRNSRWFEHDLWLAQGFAKDTSYLVPTYLSKPWLLCSNGCSALILPVRVVHDGCP